MNEEKLLKLVNKHGKLTLFISKINKESCLSNRLRILEKSNFIQFTYTDSKFKKLRTHPNFTMSCFEVYENLQISDSINRMFSYDYRMDLQIVKIKAGNKIIWKK